MKKISLLILFTLAFYSGFTQFNDSTFYYINFTGTGNINKTNDGKTYLLNNSLRFNVLVNKFELNTTNNYIYGANPTSKTNNDYLSVLDISYLKSKKGLYYWALATYEKSYSLKIDNRLQVGGGLGYGLVHNPLLSISVSNGLLYEASRLRQEDKYGRLSYETLRNSFRLKFKLNIKDKLTIENIDFLQNSLSDQHDYIIKSNTRLAFKMYKWLSLTTTLDYNRLNLTGQENILLSYGLTMEKYF